MASPVIGQRVEARESLDRREVVPIARVHAGDLRDRVAGGMIRDGLDGVAGCDVTFKSDGEAVSGSTTGEESFDHVLAAEAKPKLGAGQPRFPDNDLGAADAEAVADRDLVLEREALDREVLSERAETRSACASATCRST
jgi:hypothetical protein